MVLQATGVSAPSKKKDWIEVTTEFSGIYFPPPTVATSRCVSMTARIVLKLLLELRPPTFIIGLEDERMEGRDDVLIPARTKTFCWLSRRRLSFFSSFTSNCMSGKIKGCFPDTLTVGSGGGGLSIPVPQNFSISALSAAWVFGPAETGRAGGPPEPGEPRLHHHVRQPDEILQILFISTRASACVAEVAAFDLRTLLMH